MIKHGSLKATKEVCMRGIVLHHSSTEWFSDCICGLKSQSKRLILQGGIEGCCIIGGAVSHRRYSGSRGDVMGFEDVKRCSLLCIDQNISDPLHPTADCHVASKVSIFQQ